METANQPTLEDSSGLDAGAAAALDAGQPPDEAADDLEAVTAGAGGAAGEPALPVAGSGSSCGDGRVDADEECDGSETCAADCKPLLHPSLVHRYSFDEMGDFAIDSVGEADGEVHETELSGRDLALSGGAERVSLPNGLLSQLTSATIEVWLTWRGGARGQCIFDFGSSTAGESLADLGTSFWALSPRGAGDRLATTMNFTERHDPERDFTLAAPNRLERRREHHLAVVFDSTRGELGMYLDGASLGTLAGVAGELSQIDDVNVWIGACQSADSPALDATLHEFRIYAQSLDAAAIGRSFELGSDVAAPAR
jgi:hypothetical protein